MFRFLKVVIISVFLVSIFVTTDVYGIKCWSCSSKTDPKCGDPFDNSTLPLSNCKLEKELANLSGVKLMCRKIKQIVNGEWTYDRGCTYMDEVGIVSDEMFCLKQTGSTENCTCYGRDGCNASGILSHMPVMMIITVIGLLKNVG